jgi:ATP-binding protein involved in chromosome partitioning
MTTREAVQGELKAINDPVSGKDIVTAGLVRALTIEDGVVRFVLEIDAAHAKAMEPVRAAAEARVKAMSGVKSVSALMTAHSQKAPPNLKGASKPAPQGPQTVPGVDRVVLIASGKGGVGKSTVTANLAVALAAEGRKVGVLDADIYGPSQPRMMGVSGRPESPDGKLILPLRNHGVTMMSIGLMLPNPDEAVVWRGPMLMGALQQLMGQVQWGELDVLLVDLPPGTGDVQLTLGQKYVVDGAIIVSTPQDVALLDARKAISMFNKMDTPIIGMIENMSTHVCSKCGHEEHLFGHGGVAKEAEKLGLPLLAEIPLHLDIRLGADSGAPVVVSAPDSAQAATYRVLAKTLVAQGKA